MDAGRSLSRRVAPMEVMGDMAEMCTSELSGVLAPSFISDTKGGSLLGREHTERGRNGMALVERTLPSTFL